MINESFSIRLREARQMMGLSMDKLVERTNGAITKQSISRYEKGIMRPKRDALQAIAKALNISEEYFEGTNLKRYAYAPHHLQWRVVRRRVASPGSEALFLGRAVSSQGERSRFSYPVQESDKRHQGINP